MRSNASPVAGLDDHCLVSSRGVTILVAADAARIAAGERDCPETKSSSETPGGIPLVAGQLDSRDFDRTTLAQVALAALECVMGAGALDREEAPEAYPIGQSLTSACGLENAVRPLGER